MHLVYWTDKSSTILASASLTDWNSFHIHYGDLDGVSSLTIFDEGTQKIFGEAEHCIVVYLNKSRDVFFVLAKPPPLHTIDIYVADIKSIEKFRVDTEKR